MMASSFKKITLVALSASMATTAASAMTIREAGPPAETPPQDFLGRQYVDSRGCAYIRAGYGSSVVWVPRVTRSRQVMCDMEPTFSPKPDAIENDG